MTLLIGAYYLSLPAYSGQKELLVDRQKQVLRYVADLGEAFRREKDGFTPSSTHMILAKLVDVASEPDLSIIRDTVVKFDKQGRTFISGDPVVMALLPLIFDPVPPVEDKTTIRKVWFPLNLEGKHLRFSSSLSFTGLWSFFGKFDYLRDHSAARTKLAMFDY